MKFFDDVGVRKKIKNDLALKKKEENEALIMEIRIENEDFIKEKDMNEFLFGDFVSEVPLVKVDRLLDNPLPSSYAAPYDMKMNENKVRK